MSGYSWTATARESPWLDSLTRDSSGMERRRGSVSPGRDAEEGRHYSVLSPSRSSLPQQAAYAHLGDMVSPQYAAPAAPRNVTARGRGWAGVNRAVTQTIRRRNQGPAGGVTETNLNQYEELPEEAPKAPVTGAPTASLGSRDVSLSGGFEPVYERASPEEPEVPVQWERIRTSRVLNKECRMRFLSSLGYYTRWFSRTMPQFSQLADRVAVPVGNYRLYPLVWLDVLLRGMSQGLYMNNPVTGLIFWIAMLQANPWVGIMAFVGLLTSTMTAHLFKVHPGMLRCGLYGFSGFLTSGAVTSFNAGGAYDPSIILPCILLSMVTVVVFAGYVTLITVPYGVPPLGVPFSLVTLAWLLATYNSAYLPNTVYPEISGSLLTQKEYLVQERVAVDWAEVMLTVFRGFGLLAFDSNVTTGVIVFCGVFIASPLLAIYGWLAGLFGIMFSIAIGAPAPYAVSEESRRRDAPQQAPVRGRRMPPERRPPCYPNCQGPQPAIEGGIPGGPGGQAPSAQGGPAGGQQPNQQPVGFSPYSAETSANGGAAQYPQLPEQQARNPLLPPADSSQSYADGTSETVLDGTSNWPILYVGLACIDPIYTGMTVSMFWVPSWRTWLLSIFMGMFAAMLRNALANVFYIWGLPTLAIPFCMATFPLLLNQKIFPAFRPVPVVSLTVPEDHLNRVYKLQWVFDQIRPFLLPDTNREERRVLTKQISDRVRRVYDKHAGKGGVNKDNLVAMLSDLKALPANTRTWTAVPSATRTELSQWFAAIHATDGSKVDYDAFLLMVVEGVLTARAKWLTEQWYRLMQVDSIRYATRGGIREYLFNHGRKLTWNEEAAIFQRANKLGLNGVFILKDVATMEDVVLAMMHPPKPVY